MLVRSLTHQMLLNVNVLCSVSCDMNFFFITICMGNKKSGNNICNQDRELKTKINMHLMKEWRSKGGFLEEDEFEWYFQND